MPSARQATTMDGEGRADPSHWRPPRMGAAMVRALSAGALSLGRSRRPLGGARRRRCIVTRVPRGAGSISTLSISARMRTSPARDPSSGAARAMCRSPGRPRRRPARGRSPRPRRSAEPASPRARSRWRPPPRSTARSRPARSPLCADPEQPAAKVDPEQREHRRLERVPLREARAVPAGAGRSTSTAMSSGRSSKETRSSSTASTSSGGSAPACAVSDSTSRARPMS